MNITSVTTERIERGSHGLVVAAIIEGDIPDRAAPIVIKFGNVSAGGVADLGIAEGVRAVFSEMPPAGATLFVGYVDEPLVETRFKFVPPGETPIA